MRAGAVLIFTCLACERTSPARDEGPRVIELTDDTIELPAGVTLVQINVQRSDSGEFNPIRAEAGQNDYVRFIARDRASHAIVFEGAALDSTARAYMESKGQLRSPPLITTGSSWVITLEGAPAGEYPFRCITHNAAGTLIVRS